MLSDFSSRSPVAVSLASKAAFKSTVFCTVHRGGEITVDVVVAVVVVVVVVLAVDRIHLEGRSPMNSSEAFAIFLSCA
ncbi:hypothetical protein M7I_7474 [Glarea lozoyensis 74030]|uniref:Uncharacterized protein n=1 Tax=Glarea lozoyensis (strain ATCC 74030 / MF5533) TaxID=1104152 RepID=H0EXE0_GLAL7|nr:hypothetical protein M7I_7474 [Glarea lozoyensis 74030]